MSKIAPERVDALDEGFEFVVRVFLHDDLIGRKGMSDTEKGGSTGTNA
jgi:hypothetical protein